MGEELLQKSREIMWKTNLGWTPVEIPRKSREKVSGETYEEIAGCALKDILGEKLKIIPKNRGTKSEREKNILRGTLGTIPAELVNEILKYMERFPKMSCSSISDYPLNGGILTDSLEKSLTLNGHYSLQVSF